MNFLQCNQVLQKHGRETKRGGGACSQDDAPVWSVCYANVRAISRTLVEQEFRRSQTLRESLTKPLYTCPTPQCPFQQDAQDEQRFTVGPGVLLCFYCREKLNLCTPAQDPLLQHSPGLENLRSLLRDIGHHYPPSTPSLPSTTPPQAPPPTRHKRKTAKKAETYNNQLLDSLGVGVMLRDVPVSVTLGNFPQKQQFTQST
jgi:hypothetical protein